MSRFADDETLTLITKLQQQLAAEQVNSAKLLETIERVKQEVCGDALPNWDNSARTGYTRGRLADLCDMTLVTKPDDSALREWGARLLDWTFSKGMGGTLLLDTAMQLRSGDWKP